MGKTTNILDLNNRLEKVEKENVAQNNYNSLKNRPKINGNLLTGDKTGAQLGLAEAQDITDINTSIGNMSDLGTTATDIVGAINEVNESVGELLAPKNLLTESDDLNSLISPGIYYYEGVRSPLNIPTNAQNAILGIFRHANVSGNNRVLQVIYSFNLNIIYYRNTTDLGNNWTTWKTINTIS